MKTVPADRIQFHETDIVVDAELLASFFNMSVAFLREAMCGGRVSTLVERGEGEDAGRARLTFRYLDQQFSVMRERDGQFYETTPPAPNVRPVKPSLMQLYDPQK
jgi:hypothetical protein